MNLRNVTFLGFTTLGLFGLGSIGYGLTPILAKAFETPRFERHHASQVLGVVGSGLKYMGGLVTSAAYAAEPPAQPVDPSTLVKFDKPGYSVTYGPSVSTDPLGRSTVTKIAHGQVSTVSVVTTSSGVYSSDGLASPNVLYPGVEVQQAPRNGSVATHGLPIALWNGRSSLLLLPLDGSASTTTMTPLGNGGKVISGKFGTCVALPQSFICL